MSSIAVPVQLRWGDLDAYGHVNNVEIARLFEEARARAFWEEGPLPPLRPQEVLWSVVASLSVRYLRPLHYRSVPVLVEMTTARIGGASFDIEYVLRDGWTARTAATATSRIVLIDSATKSPHRLPGPLRDALAAFSPDPSRASPSH